jgi:sterol desaturase/sphingolipid hydroxylase (fatty acid hydroxylase superfamily)
VLFGWMIASASQISRPVADFMSGAFGPSPAIPMDEGVRRAVVTIMLFLAYEFAYWLDHYLSHKVPVLWEFHKVHHTAQVLSPLTAARVHPVDSLVFANIAAIVIGLTGGVLHYVFGSPASPFALSGANVILTAWRRKADWL